MMPPGQAQPSVRPSSVHIKRGQNGRYQATRASSDSAALKDPNMALSRPHTSLLCLPAHPESTIFQAPETPAQIARARCALRQLQSHPKRTAYILAVGPPFSPLTHSKHVPRSSGEFHTWRLPVPSLWPDILEKTKAAGLNAISIYTHMGLHNPARGVVDFDGFRALRPLYEAAMAAGVWVVVRPGPYINAETSAGGIAHWVTSEVAGHLRTNDSDWTEAWGDYIRGIIRETAPYQIDRGGPVIGESFRLVCSSPSLTWLQRSSWVHSPSSYSL
jgi:hypothetical protein